MCSKNSSNSLIFFVIFQSSMTDTQFPIFFYGMLQPRLASTPLSLASECLMLTLKLATKSTHFRQGITKRIAIYFGMCWPVAHLYSKVLSSSSPLQDCFVLFSKLPLIVYFTVGGRSAGNPRTDPPISLVLLSPSL